MSDLLSTLTQAELLALALDAARRNDSGRALAYLKEAAGRPDVSARALFMLGSEYAQLGLAPQAKAHMSRAVACGEDFPLARFQLGMLHVTSGENELAKAAWAPLTELAGEHPDAYLKAFHRGMRHLVDDEFDAALQALREGVASNRVNEALNADMRRVIDAVEHLPGRQGMSTGAVDEGHAQAAPAAIVPSQSPPLASGEVDADVEPSHLFISAYTHRGKPH